MAFKFNPFTGNFDITGSGGGGGAPVGAEYVTLIADGTLTGERVLNAPVGSGLTITDNGAGNTVDIELTTPIQEIPNRHFVMSLMGA